LTEILKKIEKNSFFLKKRVKTIENHNAMRYIKEGKTKGTINDDQKF